MKLASLRSVLVLWHKCSVKYLQYKSATQGTMPWNAHVGLPKIVPVIAAACITMACNNKKQEPDKEREAYINALQQQVQQNPDSIGLTIQLADALKDNGDYKKAIGEVEKLIAKDSLNYGLWYKKAQIQEAGGDTTAAFTSYHRAERIYPSADVLLALANLYAETKNTKALQYCTRIAELRMGREYDSYAAFFAGVYYARTGDTKQALSLFDKAINDNYSLMDIYIEKGALLYDIKQYPEALKVFNTAVTINNTYALGYYWKAKCEEALGQKAAAATNYEKALSLDKDLTEAQQGLKRVQ